MEVFQQSQSPVPGDFPGGLLDQTNQGAMAGLIRHLHELMLLQANLDESVLVPALCRRACLEVPSFFASVAKAFSFFGWSFKCLWAFKCFHGTQKHLSKQMLEAGEECCPLKVTGRELAPPSQLNSLTSALQLRGPACWLAFCTPCMPSLHTGFWERGCVVRT